MMQKINFGGFFGTEIEVNINLKIGKGKMQKSLMLDLNINVFILLLQNMYQYIYTEQEIDPLFQTENILILQEYKDINVRYE